jgi:acetolactate synthase-1/2/3 large subunit
MLKAISKAAFRIRSVETAIHHQAGGADRADPPMGPVSVEIPIDIQAALIPMPSNLRRWPYRTRPSARAG